MPNGDDGKYNADWCKAERERIHTKFDEVWGEKHGGITALWKSINRMNAKLCTIIVLQLTILGGVISKLIEW